MSKEKSIEKIERYFEWVNNEGPIHVPQEVLNALYELKQPQTLADFLGWREGQEHEWRGDKYRIQSDILQVYDRVDEMWCDSAEELNDYLRLRQAKKAEKDKEEPKFYAKIKGSELAVYDTDTFWNYNMRDNALFLSGTKEFRNIKTIFTKTEWAELGITDENACFEEVK